MKAYLIRGRSIDGDVWLSLHHGSTCWNSQKSDATEFLDEDMAQTILALMIQRNKGKDLDNIVGQLTIVQIVLSME